MYTNNIEETWEIKDMFSIKNLLIMDWIKVDRNKDYLPVKCPPVIKKISGKKKIACRTLKHVAWYLNIKYWKITKLSIKLQKPNN